MKTQNKIPADFSSPLATITYRGQRIQSTVEYQREGTYYKMYWVLAEDGRQRYGCPSLRGMMADRDYELSGASELTEELVAKSPGSVRSFDGVAYLKTNLVDDADATEKRYSSFVTLYTGEIIHANTLACKIVGYVSRRK